MLSVTFQAPIVVDEKNLSSLLALAGVAAVVEPYVEAKRPGRKPAAPVEQLASSSEPEGVKPAGKKRGRKSAAEKEAAAAEAPAEAPAPAPERKKPGRKPKAKPTGEAAPAEEPTEAPAAAAPTGDLLERFAALIDSDFEGAKGILEELGVERFSDLPESEYPAFDAAMQKLGA